MLRLLRKENSTRLAPGLAVQEFACKCKNESCRAILIDTKLVKAYKKFRETVGVKLIINSGYRCQLHNLQTPNSSVLSRHTAGQAIDISLKTLNHLSQDDIEHAAKIAGFTFIKFYKTFVHFDVR